jgi:aspartate-semialdehyde dehydrogenase
MRADGYRVAVVGATGQVGAVMLRLLEERGFPAREVVPFASERSAGKVLDNGLTVQPLTDETIQGFDIAIFSAGGSTSGEWAPRFADAGAVVIDNSSKWRMHDEVPLVVAGVNDDALEGHDGIVANPNCSTMQMVVALRPLHDAAGIERLVVSTYQAVSGTGKKGIDELTAQTRAVLAGEDVPAPVAYKQQIAFNALPHAGNFAPGDDHTDEERKLINETRKILGDPSIRVSATCVRVPVINGHSEAVNVELRGPLEPEQARELLRATPGATVLDDPDANSYPMAIEASGKDDVFVGRIRRDPGNDRALEQRQSARPVGRLRQPAQGRRAQRRPARRAAARARAGARVGTVGGRGRIGTPPRRPIVARDGQAMIDLHCHLLPALDDGPRDLAGAVALARAQVAAGVRTVAVTPHAVDRFPNEGARVAAGVEQLRAALREDGVPLELRSGAEVDLLHALEQPDEALAQLTLGGGPWLLLEAPTTTVAALEAGAARLQQRGFRLLLAHPERAPSLQREPAMLERLVRRGVRTQLTAGGLNGQFGKTVQRFALRLIDDGLIHTFASDAHDVARRLPGLREPLEKAGLGEHVELLCEQHPAAILAGGELPETVALPRRGSGSLLSRLRR